jgi:hypothetical protein
VRGKITAYTGATLRKDLSPAEQSAFMEAYTSKDRATRWSRLAQYFTGGGEVISNNLMEADVVLNENYDDSMFTSSQIPNGYQVWDNILQKSYAKQ